ncbi:MAG: DUF427 domain-containing protein [Deltaproteobacteria bacterium]|nr:DUF427 domain-containing protein [Deltaproteobacteria bacterium]
MSMEARVPLYGDPGHWIHVSQSPRQVRVTFSGETIADSKQVKLLREAGVLPVYYFPPEDVCKKFLRETQQKSRCPYKGEASYWTVRIGDNVADNAAWTYFTPLPEAEGLRGFFAFEWNKMDAWYEEDEEVFVHPRDPYKRVDVLQSKRHVVVRIAGDIVADTRRPRVLFETNHPVRYYIFPEDIRMDLLEASATKSRCPYKGRADYWSVRVRERLFKDLVWGYMEPIPECPKIKGLLCFFQERGAEIYVDDERIATPKTKWATVAEPNEA